MGEVNATLGRVLVSDAVDRAGLSALAEAFELDYRPGLSPSALLEAVVDQGALIVRSETKVTAEVIAAGSRLKVIGRAGVGVDNIDIPAASARGVLVVNAPSGNTLAAAEMTIALLLSWARQIAPAAGGMREGRWDRKRFMGVELAGKTVGIVGLGRVGSAVARRLAAFDMRVLVYDPHVDVRLKPDMHVQPVSLHVLLHESDFVSMHTTLNAHTRHMLNAERLSWMKPDAVLINTARGDLIDEDALLRALNEGQLAGAALDVFATEPPTNRDLIEHERVLATPHLGASTRDAQRHVAEEVAVQVAAALRGEHPPNAINAAAVAELHKHS